MRMNADKELLSQMELAYELLDSGCCGMAGSFGFHKGELYDVSIQCGERVLLPAVREADAETVIVSDGFSCREQIAQTTNRRALHLAQVLEMALREGPDGPAGALPESAYVTAAANRSGTAVAALTGAAILAAAFFWRRRKSGD
jgi:MYXO-CTERM domain-containing protein